MSYSQHYKVSPGVDNEWEVRSRLDYTKVLYKEGLSDCKAWLELNDKGYFN